MQQNGCFPLLVRVSGLFAIFPFIVPSLSPFSLLSLSLVFFGSGSWAGSWKDQTRTDQADQTRQTRLPRPGQTWADLADLGRPGQTWAERTDPGRSEQAGRGFICV